MNDEQAVHRQYANAGNFNARIHLNRTYGMNPYPWPLWVFDRLREGGELKVLELGGGSGLLWTANAGRIPAGWDITVTDISPGMLEEASRALASVGGRIRLEVVDAERIPYPDGQFDIAIANHMLYHVGNRRQALQEIKRVLKPDGVFYASTVGQGNMAELKALVRSFDPDSGYEDVLGTIETNFSLENGGAQLAEAFGVVRLLPYEDGLKVTDAAAIVNYLLSWNGADGQRVVLEPRRIGEFRAYLEAEMAKNGGSFDISKASGLFECLP